MILWAIIKMKQLLRVFSLGYPHKQRLTSLLKEVIFCLFIFIVAVFCRVGVAYFSYEELLFGDSCMSLCFPLEDVFIYNQF